MSQLSVTIYYCKLCKLREPAEAISAALGEQLGVDCTLREGFWGTFRVEVEGQEVFNRWKSRGLWGRLGFGRTPTPTEIVPLVAALLPVQSATSATPS